MSNRDDLDTPFSPREEAIAKEVLEKGLGRYAKIATPEMLAVMGKLGIEGLRTHPALRRMIRRLAAAGETVDVSGSKPKGGGAGEDEDKDEGSGGSDA
jgi:hypothetical protein